MGNTAELVLEDFLSQSQCLARHERANSPTVGIRLDPVKETHAPKMTGGRVELNLVPDEERARSDSMQLELAIIGILWKV